MLPRMTTLPLLRPKPPCPFAWHFLIAVPCPTPQYYLCSLWHCLLVQQNRFQHCSQMLRWSWCYDKGVRKKCIKRVSLWAPKRIFPQRITYFTPTTPPFKVNKGPPEFPGLIAASVCIQFLIAFPATPVTDRPNALTKPEERVRSSPNGLPMAFESRRKSRYGCERGGGGVGYKKNK